MKVDAATSLRGLPANKLFTGVTKTYENYSRVLDLVIFDFIEPYRVLKSSYGFEILQDNVNHREMQLRGNLVA